MNLEQFGTRPALEMHDGVVVSYQDLARLADHFGQHFVQNDVWTEQLCTLRCRNNLMTIVAWLSCLRHRRPVVLLPDDCPQNEVNRLIQQFDICAAISAHGEVQRVSGSSFRTHPELMMLRPLQFGSSTLSLLPFQRTCAVQAGKAMAAMLELRPTTQLLVSHSIAHPVALMQLMAGLSAGAFLKLLPTPLGSKAYWLAVAKAPEAQLWLSGQGLQNWQQLSEPLKQRFGNPLRTFLPLASNYQLPRLGEWLCYYQEEALTPLTVEPDAWQLGFYRQQIIGDMTFQVRPHAPATPVTGTSVVGTLQFDHPYAAQAAVTSSRALRQATPGQIFDSLCSFSQRQDFGLVPLDDAKQACWQADFRLDLPGLQQSLQLPEHQVLLCTKGGHLYIVVVSPTPDSQLKTRMEQRMLQLLPYPQLVYSVVIVRDIPYLPGFKVNIDALVAASQQPLPKATIAM